MMEKDPITQFLPQIYAFPYKYVCRRWYFIWGKKSQVVRDVEEVGCSLLSGSRYRTLLSHPKLGFPTLPKSLSSCLSPFHFDVSLGLTIINGWWWEILTELQVSDWNSRLLPLFPKLLAVLAKHVESFHLQFVGINKKYLVRMCNNSVYTYNKTRVVIY